jgi:DHA1 family tetracycline resistance protein-like MFS transporter
MGLFGAAFGLGFILGPALAGILSGYGVHVPFYFAAGLSFANAIALYFLLPESIKPDSYVEKPKTSRLMDIFRSLQDKRFGLLNLDYFLLVTAFSIMTYAFVLFTSYRFHYDAAQNGYLFMFIGIIAVVGQGLLFGRLERSFGESRLIIAGCVMMAVALFLMPVIGPEYGGLAALMAVGALLSLGNSLASPAITSLASRISNEDEQGSKLGIMQSGASLARAIAPMIGGVLLNNAVDSMDDHTISRTFITASGIMVLALIVSIYAHGTLSIRVSSDAV